MAGRMGGDQVTVKNLRVAGIEPERNLLLVRGAVPGANSGIVIIHSVSGDFEKRFLETKKKDEKAS